MQEILSFIAQRRSIGQSDQEISNELISAGWDQAMVAQSFQASPPASVPHETIVPPAQPTQQFYPQQQSVQPQQATSQPVEQEIQPMPMLPRQTGKLPLIIVGVITFIVLGLGGFLLINQMGSDTPANDSSGVAERDTERRADVSRLLAEAETQASINNGRYPEATLDGWEILIGNFRDFNDPGTGDPYEFTTATPASGQMQYANRVVCNEDRLAVGNERSFVIRVLLESGAIYCLDNT